MKRYIKIFFCLCFAVHLAVAEPISEKGMALNHYLDKLDVEQKWLAGQHVNWLTGAPDGITTGAIYTHCSAFAAAATSRLHIYLLHPPAHQQLLLANAQADWLNSAQARQQGWFAVPNGFAAQAYANRGYFVAAVFRNPDSNKPGHIAIIRPSEKSDALLQAEGPEIVQAGKTNAEAISLKEGFKHHPGAFEQGHILFYGHKIAWQDNK